MPTVYKTLFDIKLMHEYYLTREDGTVVFSLASQPDRLAFLEEEFAKDNASINDDVSFEFPEKLKAGYDSSFVKLLPSYSGCRVAIRVNAHTLPDQSVVYDPFIPLDDLNIWILINRKHFAIDAFSNTRISWPVSPVYFFSNVNFITPGNFPFLTTQLAATDITYPYEQGELSLSAGGKTQEYYRKGNADVWDEVPGEGFAGERDRLLVPESFQYTISDVTALTELKFVLTDFAATEVSSITISNASGVSKKSSLDFAGKIKSLPPVGSYNVNEYLYTLKVSGNNGYEASHAVIFSNDLLSSDAWGVIMIRLTKGSDPYNIFAADNYIRKRKDGLGVWTDAPVFEIPVKSRLAYWRFVSNKGKELAVSAPLVNFVKKEGDIIETLKPRSLAMHSFMISKDVPMSTDTVYVPNPEFPGIKIEDDRRLFFDIRVPNSELFPEVP
jgi:hypothetical protein